MLNEISAVLLRPRFRTFQAAYNIIRNITTVKRFYRRTNVLSNGNGRFEITLDQRKLKTPKGHTFVVNNKPLALAIAAEWDAQKEIVDRSNMHLTALCNTVLDNPQNLTKEDIVNHIVNCLESDTILFQTNDVEELYKMQLEKWDPVIQWFCDRFHVDIAKTQCIEPPAIPASTKLTLTRHLSSYDFNAIHGFKYAVDALKSVILTMATASRAIGVEEAVKLSRLEEIYQTSHWGSVEWSHDLSKEDLQARLSAAILFVHFNSHSATSRLKADAKSVQ